MKSKLIFILLIMAYVVSAPGAWPTQKTEEQSMPDTIEYEYLPADTETPSSDKSCSYSAEEKELIARVVFAEARGECDEGQQAVAQVIINRMKSPLYQDTVSEVINRRGQFVIADRYTEKEVKNVEIVIDNEFDMPGDVLYFGTWRFRENVWRKIGNHYFMR